MVQALPQYSQAQVAPSQQVVVPQGNPQWQSQPQLVNPYLSTGQTPQSYHPQQFQPTQGGWVQTTPQMAVASQQPNHQAEYLALNSVAPNYSQSLPSPQPQYSQASPQARSHQFKIDLNEPSGKDSQGNPLASVIELINSFGGGRPELAIARIHQQLILREDQLGEVVAYTQALEKEAIWMGEVLSNPENTGKWLQYQEFHLAQLPEVINFRNAYPEATFEQYYDYLVKSNTPQGQSERPPAPLGYEYAPEPQKPTFNQMNMGVGQGSGGQVATRKIDLLRQIDSGHFGQFFSQLA